MSTSSTIADSSAPSANHTIIRVGLIGVGNWALNGPVRVLSLMPQYEMAAVYSQRRDAAQSAADTFGIRHVVGSIDELVRHPDVDIVLVLTTGPQHEEAVRAAIAAGKAVYCEWPLTPDSKTSAELVDLAAKAGVQTILGTQRRFAPGLRYLKDLLGDGYVGRVRSVRMHVTVSSFGKNRSKALRWSAFPENFMGVTSIFGAHLMDPLFSIVGRPTEISAVSVNQWPKITIVETGEEISTKVPDQLLLQGILASGAVFAVHIEGGKHHGTGVRSISRVMMVTCRSPTPRRSGTWAKNIIYSVPAWRTPRWRHSQCPHRTTGCHPLIFLAACWSSPISSRFMPAISQAAREPCPASRTPSSCSGCLNRQRSRQPADIASSFRRCRGRSSALGQITPAATILHQLPSNIRAALRAGER